MKKNKTISAKILILFLCFTILYMPMLVEAKTVTKQVTGQLINEVIPAPSLKNNIVGEAASQPAVVYLPPTYAKCNKSYPVVYFLPGWGDDYRTYTNGTFNNFKLKDVMDQLIERGKINEMIVVIPNGISKYVGQYYVNSPVLGNWEDFIVKDVTKYIDKKYRTVKSPSGRGLSGHSMGGYGALNLSMKHADVYGSVYSMSPGLFDKDWLSYLYMLNDKKYIREFRDIESSYESKPVEEAKKEFMDNIATSKFTFEFMFAVSYGAAFSPNPQKFVPINYPCKIVDDKIVCDQKILDDWFNGFGGIEKNVPKYKKNLLKLGQIGIEYGIKEENKFIPTGCVSLVNELKREHIPCSLITFDGGHQDLLGERLEKNMLPFFSEKFSAKKH